MRGVFRLSLGDLTFLLGACPGRLPAFAKGSCFGFTITAFDLSEARIGVRCCVKSARSFSLSFSWIRSERVLLARLVGRFLIRLLSSFFCYSVTYADFRTAVKGLDYEDDVTLPFSLATELFFLNFLVGAFEMPTFFDSMLLPC